MNRNEMGKSKKTETPSGGNGEKKHPVLESLRELIVYGIVGVMTTVVYFLIYAVLKYLGINYMMNSCISWIAAVLFAFFANKYWVFRSRDNGLLLQEMVSFFGARIATLLADLLITWSCIELLHIGEWKTKIFSQIAVMVLNYLFSKLLVFREGQKKG